MDQTAECFRGCLFCRSGKEAETVQRFGVLFPQARAIAPTRTRYRRVGGIAHEEQAILLPGYVFFETAEALEPRNLRLLRQACGMLRLLTYDDGDWRLHGHDDQFARMMFDADGQIGLSRAWFDEGDRIRVLDGFLKAYEGSILRVNRRARTAQVSIDFQGKTVTMWLGFELIDRK